MGGIDLETGIWSLEVAQKRHRYDLRLAQKIAELYRPQRMADVGCGPGMYCSFFKGLGWPVVHGYEGTPDIKELGVYGDILQVDLTKNRWVAIDYDLVLCLEVGEHIPKEYEQICIDNVCRYVSKDLMLSWAVPGQGGKGHFNERPNGYVIDQLRKRGLRFDKKRSKQLREAATLKWFKNTLMVFDREESDGKS